MKVQSSGRTRIDTPGGQRVLFDKTRAAVFWTKDPGSLLAKADEIDELGLHWYAQVTLNDYEGLGYELRVPLLAKRVRDFQDLSRRIGKERVVWRFDPLLLSGTLPLSSLQERIERLFSLLGPFCERMVFSYIDLRYRGGNEKYQAVWFVLISGNFSLKKN